MTEKCRDILEKVKSELRDQVCLWTSELMRDRSMNLTLQRRIENAIDKSMTIQKVRIKHAEKLLGDIEHDTSSKADLVNEFQTYWSAIVPDIQKTLEEFKFISAKRNVEHEIDKLEIPQTMHIPSISLEKSWSKHEKTQSTSTDTEKLHRAAKAKTGRSPSGR